LYVNLDEIPEVSVIKDKLESCAAHGNTEELDVGWEVEVGKWQTYLSSTGNA
jgi:hypothetical protein